jgi:hypothetical protein
VLDKMKRTGIYRIRKNEEDIKGAQYSNSLLRRCRASSALTSFPTWFFFLNIL